MGKQEIKQKETQVSTNGGIGKQLEQTFTVDDNCLPSPGELQAYKNIDPRIVDYLIDASVKEQTHRHAMDKQKLQIIKKTEGRIGRMNWWGMFFAFLCILVFSTVTGYALYLDKPWFAGIMGGAVLISIVSIFVKGNSEENSAKKNDGCFLSTSNKAKAAAVLPSAAFFLSFCSSVQEPHSPGSPRHSVIASCCSGVNARCRGL